MCALARPKFRHCEDLHHVSFLGHVILAMSLGSGEAEAEGNPDADVAEDVVLDVAEDGGDVLCSS